MKLAPGVCGVTLESDLLPVASKSLAIKLGSGEFAVQSHQHADMCCVTVIQLTCRTHNTELQLIQALVAQYTFNIRLL
jgi:hypothetical protein